MASFKERIIGTWELQQYAAVNDADPTDILYPMGKGCKGQIIYSRDGYMAALLQFGDVKGYDDGWKHGTRDELAMAAKKTLAYCGPFYLDEIPGNRQLVFHHSHIAIPLNWVGTFQPRKAHMLEEDGEQLLILGPEEPMVHKGVTRTVTLRWKKASPNTANKPPAEPKL